MDECEVCGVEIPPMSPGPGRPRRYCSPGHRQQAYWDRKLKEAYERGVDDGKMSQVKKVRKFLGVDSNDG